MKPRLPSPVLLAPVYVVDVMELYRAVFKLDARSATLSGLCERLGITVQLLSDEVNAKPGWCAGNEAQYGPA